MQFICEEHDGVFVYESSFRNATCPVCELKAENDKLTNENQELQQENESLEDEINSLR